MPHHHPSCRLMTRYATGNLSEPMALLIATHLALCPECREKQAVFEKLGGDMLEHCGTLEVSAACREKVMRALDQPVPDRDEPADHFVCRILPRPLRDYVGCGADQIAWTHRWKGIDALRLDGHRHALLVRVAAGHRIARHLHLRPETTLVLAGTLTDGHITYSRGDLAAMALGTLHAPTAGYEQDCLCLIVHGA